MLYNQLVIHVFEKLYRSCSFKVRVKSEIKLNTEGVLILVQTRISRVVRYWDNLFPRWTVWNNILLKGFSTMINIRLTLNY